MNSGPGSLRIALANGSTTYAPGQRQRVIVTISDPEGRRWGFQASPRRATEPTAGVGQLITTNGNTQLLGSASAVQWVTHTAPGTRNGTPGPVTFEFDWLAPATDAGNVELYAAANAANGTGNNQGDFIYTTKATFTPAAPLQRPAVVSGGVVSGATPRAGVVPGSWITVWGQNLAPGAREWRADEIVNGALPTSLDGVSVELNGRRAAISYVSPGQINAQAPDDASTGNVNVVVKHAGGESAPIPAMLQQFSPAFFTYGQRDNRYAAVVTNDGAALGPVGLFANGPTTRPARPGETILLFGTGFGPTSPAVPSGRTVPTSAPLANNVTITIGGSPATATFAGITGPGLYQFNVTVPAALADGDHPVMATIGGVQTPTGVFLAVGR